MKREVSSSGGNAEMSQERIASVRESTHDLTSVIHNFEQNWFEQIYVMKEEHTGPLPADSSSWISATIFCCNSQGRMKEPFPSFLQGILLCIASLGTFSIFLGGDPSPLMISVTRAFGK